MQARSQGRRKAPRPSGVDQFDIDQVAQVHAIFILKRCQFHANQGVQREKMEAAYFGRFGDLGGGQEIVVADFLARKDQIHGVASLGVGPSRNLSILAAWR